MGDIKYYLAVDIGASSGRHMLAHMEDGVIRLEEVYRFRNGNDKVKGTDGKEHRVWDTERLFNEVLEGMKKCAQSGRIPYSMGIDTWAVDYVLLDSNDRMLGPCYAYRDGRTQGMDALVYETISEEELYKRTGIQKAIFNTIYQLKADLAWEPWRLEQAKSLLMVPDYLNFLLTGKKNQEYTNASTTGLMDPERKDWDYELIDMLGLPSRLFAATAMPGTFVGTLTEEIQKKVGFDCKVVAPATHDTGSAVMSLPFEESAAADKDTLYISSGTWSLMGCELKGAICDENAYKANFTNEGGYDHRFRFLKNIMGLWMIQEAAKEAGISDFGMLCEKAEKEIIMSLVDANDERFLAPVSMSGEVAAFCEETGQEVPANVWQTARVIYRSLAKCYQKAAEDIEAITGKSFDSINIVGGGSKADWLNKLTAKETGRKVIAGPSEATAIGNIGAQMIADGVIADLPDFRKCVYRSFGVREYAGGESAER